MSSREITYEATPRVYDYGLCELINFGAKDKELTTVAFYTMPLYEMDL